MGPALSAGRVSDHRSPWYEVPIEAGAWSLSRLHVGTLILDRQGRSLDLLRCAPKQVGQFKEVPVLLGSHVLLPMRLLLLRVPVAVAEQRRERLIAEAKRRGHTVSELTLALADWTLLITDVPCSRLSVFEALVLLRERWQMELLYKLWKHGGQLDQWRTANPWRILCEVYAKLIGGLVQHWLIVVLAWLDPQRSLVKLAQVVRATGWSIMEALAGFRSLRSALQLIARRMRSGCQMNTRKKHPNSAQLLQRQAVEWALSNP
jgi:hypothetical protein